jgi:GTP:adenosylcobinamide-phosphate guanylyltransferase
MKIAAEKALLSVTADPLLKFVIGRFQKCVWWFK